MIPFSGFMQANTFSATSFGGKPVDHANTPKGLHDIDDAIARFDDNDGSFLQWVQKLVDDDMPVEPDTERVLNPKRGNPEGEDSPFDPLLALFAESMDQPPVSQNEPQIANGEDLDDGQPLMPPAILNAINAQSRAVEGAQVPKNDMQTGGRTTSTADALPNQINANGNPIQNEMPIEGGGQQEGSIEMGSMKKKPIDMAATHDTSTVRSDQENNPSLLKPVGPANETEKTSTIQIAQQGSPSGSGIYEKAIDPKPAYGQPFAGSTNNPESIPNMQSSEEMGSSGDDTAHFQDGGKRSQTQRMAFAEVKEAELQKDQSLDSMKNFAGDPIKSDPSFQDTAKAMTPEPSTIVTEKSTVGQASALARPETPSAGTLQSTVMDQIVDKASLRSIHGRSEVKISLKPEFLGNVQMNIATDKEQVVVRIITDQPVVKDIIETHLHHLKAELQNQGLTIDKFDVVVNPDADQQHSRETFSQMFKNNSSNGGRRQAQDQNPGKGSPESGNDATDDDEPNRDRVNYFA